MELCNPGCVQALSRIAFLSFEIISYLSEGDIYFVEIEQKTSARFKCLKRTAAHQFYGKLDLGERFRKL
jgi:hypothetical protein